MKLWRGWGGWVRIRLPSVPLCLSGPFPEQPTYVREEERHPPCEQEPVPAPNMQGLVLRVVVMHPPCEREAAHAVLDGRNERAVYRLDIGPEISPFEQRLSVSRVNELPVGRRNPSAVCRWQ